MFRFRPLLDIYTGALHKFLMKLSCYKEDGGSKFLGDLGNYIHYSASEPRSTQSSSYEIKIKYSIHTKCLIKLTYIILQLASFYVMDMPRKYSVLC